jgi:hypothetical protein
MLDADLNQAAGLHALAVQSAPRIIVMASHDDRPSELPLLCSLCTAWTDLGYPVLVLDATLAESDSSPGLQQLLASADRTGIADRSQSIWPILPAALGLEQLCLTRPGNSGARPPLQHLGTMFRDYEIVLVYASAQNLASYLPDSGVEPLLAFSTKGMTILSAYQALKQLLINGRLQPTMVAVMNETDRNNLASAHSMCKSLQDCAMAFLGHHLTLLPVDAQALDGQAPENMSQLALRLLESALSPGYGIPAMAASSDSYVPRSH